MAKIRKLSKEEIKAINKKALEKIEKMEVKRGRKSESEDFLLEIKEVIDKALKKEIPFTQISKLIKDMYNINISVNILKHFAKKHLNYVAKKHNNKATDLVKDKEENDSGRINANINDL